MRKIVIVLLIAVVASCSSIDCPVKNTVATGYSLMKADGTADTLIYDTLWVWTVLQNGKDSLLMNRLCGSKAYQMKLPISYMQPEDVLCLAVKDTTGNIWLDSIRIQKENYPHFESVDCQAAFFHKITGVQCTHSIIDSIVVKNPHVNYDETTHFLLYLKARH